MNIIERRNRMQGIYRKYSNNPSLRHLMYWGIAVAVLCILFILSGIIFFNRNLWTFYHVSRGCAGLCGCSLFVIAAIYYYRLNSMAMKDPDNWRRRNE